MSSPRPIAPSSGTPATSVAKRMQRVQWMQRVMMVLTSAPRYLSSTALVFLVAAGVDPIGHGLVLQVAFPALIADRAIQRVIDQQELHHAFARLLDHRGLGVDRRRLALGPGPAVAHPPGAACDRFRRADELNQAHAAIAGDRQPLVEAKPRNLRARRLARL